MSTIINTANAPAAIGPYSQAVKVGDMIFCSGQIAIDPKTAKIVEGGIEEQTEQVLQNLEAVLKEAGASFGDVVKTTIYLSDFGDFQKVNGIYAKRFASSPPARATVEVSRLPMDVRIEIDAIAVCS